MEIASKKSHFVHVAVGVQQRKVQEVVEVPQALKIGWWCCQLQWWADQLHCHHHQGLEHLAEEVQAEVQHLPLRWRMLLLLQLAVKVVALQSLSIINI
jgi:hypothetical protein